MNKHYLYPGSIFISKQPHIVHTVLGSCIAVFLWDPILKFGGVNHFMLPHWNGDGLPSDKYGNIAIPALINKMLGLGSVKPNLIAKVFGGSQINASRETYSIGKRNSQLAFEILAEESIPVISNSVGGLLGRKVIFNSGNGEVMIRKLNRSQGIEVEKEIPKS